MTDQPAHSAEIRRDHDVAAHTPGPWVVVVNSRGAAVAIDAPSVANIPGKTNPVRHNGIGSPHSAKGHANARLIAAAPDLLEAAAELEGWISRVLVHTYTNRKPMPENLEVALEKIRAAIAKATGAPQ